MSDRIDPPVSSAANVPHEEGEPETIRDPLSPVSPKVAEAFPVPDWQPSKVAKRSGCAPLKRGSRVRSTADTSLIGTVVNSRWQSVRWIYMVRWDGYEHDSGQYGIRDLEALRGR